MRNELSIQKKLIIGSSLTLGLMMVLGMVSIFSIQSINHTNHWVNHTQNVLSQANSLTASVIDMETGMRGYLLAGDKEFLEPYKSGSTRFDDDINKLKNTVSDNPTQVKLLENIESTIGNWRSEVVQPITKLRNEVNNSKSMSDMTSFVQAEKGKVFFDKFRGQISKFIEIEQQLLSSRQKAMDFEKNVSKEERIKQISWVTHTYKVIAMAQNILSAAIDMETGMRGFLLTGKENFLEPYHGGSKNFAGQVEALKETVSDNPSQVDRLSQIANTINNWQNLVVNQAFELRKTINDAKTMEDVSHVVAQAKGNTYIDRFRRMINQFKRNEQLLMTSRQKGVTSTTFWTYVFIGFSILVAALASLLTHIFLSSSIKNFSQVLGEMNVSVEEVNQTAQTIGQSSHQLSDNVNMQASSVEETSANMEEINSMVVNNVKLAEQSKANSEDVNSNIEDLKLAMEKISESNSQIEGLSKLIEEIGSKTAVINEIVFQTKLLSFNASVEAERAGEHGRGFAVVAQEVGNLAQMSGKAATEITQIVKNSTERATLIASENTQRVDRGVNIMSEVSKKAKLAAAGANQILDASHEQENGISQIKEAIISISKTTQQTSIVAEGNSKSGETLKDQALAINKNVDSLNKILLGELQALVDENEENDESLLSSRASHLQLIDTSSNPEAEHTNSPIAEVEKTAWEPQGAYEKKVVGSDIGSSSSDESAWKKI